MYDCRIIGSNLGASICFFECSSWEPCWPFCEPYLSVSNSSRGWTYSNAFGYCTEDDDVEMAFLFSPLQELGYPVLSFKGGDGIIRGTLFLNHPEWRLGDFSDVVLFLPRLHMRYIGPTWHCHKCTL